MPCVQCPVMENAMPLAPPITSEWATANVTESTMFPMEVFTCSTWSERRRPSRQWSSHWSGEDSPHNEADPSGDWFTLPGCQTLPQKCHFKKAIAWSFGKGDLCSFSLSTNIFESLLCAWHSPGPGEIAVNKADKTPALQSFHSWMGRSNKQNKQIKC